MHSRGKSTSAPAPTLSGKMTSRTAQRVAGITIIFGIISLYWFIGFRKGGESGVALPEKEMGKRPVVTIRQGSIVGIEAAAGSGAAPQVLEKFLGIPYGLPTGGERRFSSPVPIPASEMEFDATKFGKRCPAGGNEGSESEDCLHLNIFRPKRRDVKAKLPVLVYIHGGSFNFGAGETRQISNLVAWSSKPMIGISFNYRVGAFGFLPSKLMAEEGLLNTGLKDQELVLKWVQENIEAFGGDPGDVTIMGASAGAHSVGHHLMHNPEQPPLFHKAIIESGAATSRAVYPYDNALHEKQFHDFLIQLRLQDVPSDAILPALRELTTSQIKRASEAVFNRYNPSVRWPFQPVIDGPGGMIAMAPIKAWQLGKWHKVPILTGFNTNEGAVFVPAALSKASEFTAFFQTLLPGLSPQDLRLLDEVYPDPVAHSKSKYVETRKNLGAQFKRLEQAYGHFAYIAPVRHTAHFAAEGPAPVYLYHFAVNSSVKGGADHGNHQPFVTFNGEIRDWSPTIHAISATMHEYWASFITTGDPNGAKGRLKEKPVWPKYVAGGKAKKLLFGEGNDEIAGQGNKGVVAQVVDDAWAKEECDFWWERTEKFEI